MQPKILCDENIAFAPEAFSTIGQVALSHGRLITREMVREYDIVLVRSITRINEELLKGSAVSFVGTATIGRDHVDENYLHEKNIAFADAKGCNAQAVAEYILAAVAKLWHSRGRDFTGCSAGIIGYGNIGKKVAAILSSIGFTVYINDPPLEEESAEDFYVSLNAALSADIVTFHTPYTRDGAYPTHHLLNEQTAEFIKPGAVVVNASRGEVVETNTALKLHTEKGVTLITDVWENEPDVSSDHIRSSLYSSPHIAGYTHRGKIQGTVLLYDSLCAFLGKEPIWNPEYPVPPENLLMPEVRTCKPEDIYGATSVIDRLEDDTAAMKKMIEFNRAASGVYFDELRKNYPLRYELTDFAKGRGLLKKLGL